jgi:uncharacterized lipoprotein YmbA
MKRERLVWIVVMGALMAFLILNGCGGSRPAKFYILNSVNAPGGEGKQAAPSAVPAVTVGVGPVEIPDYVDRPSIVTRTSQNGLEVAQFDRWGGGLKLDVERVLVENLSALLPADQVAVVSWKRGVALQHRVAVDVTRFDATPGDSVWLKAQWAIFGQDGKTVAVAREANIREPVGGRDYATVVAAMSRALGKLSQEMANGLTSVLSLKPKGG